MPSPQRMTLGRCHSHRVLIGNNCGKASIVRRMGRGCRLSELSHHKAAVAGNWANQRECRSTGSYDRRINAKHETKNEIRHTAFLGNALIATAISHGLKHKTFMELHVATEDWCSPHDGGDSTRVEYPAIPRTGHHRRHGRRLRPLLGHLVC